MFKRMRRAGKLVCFGAIIITGLLVLVNYNEPVQKSVLDKREESLEKLWFLNRPIMFFNLQDLTSLTPYIFFPGGICNQLAEYEGYNVHDASLSNVIINESDLRNAYIYNGDLNSCNIEDCTIISSTLTNCFIGPNVTLLNCNPPGSDPANNKPLSIYFSEKLNIKYNIVKNNYLDYYNDTNELQDYMETLMPENFVPDSGRIMSYLSEKTNSTIIELYRVHNESLTLNCSFTFVDPYTMNSIGSYSNQSTNINFNVTIILQEDGNYSVTKMNYSGLLNYSSNGIELNHFITEDYKLLTYEDSEKKANLELSIKNFTGSSNYSSNTKLMIYNSTIENINIILNRFNNTYINQTNNMNLDTYSVDFVINDNNNDRIWTNIGDIYYNYKIINNTLFSTIKAEATGNLTMYGWVFTAGNVTYNHYMLENGTTIDPQHHLDDKKPYKIFRKKVGGRVEWGYKLTKNDISTIDQIIIGGGFVGGVGGIVGAATKLGPAIVKIAATIGLTAQTGGIVLIIIACMIAWWEIVKREYTDEDDTEDLDFHFTVKGYYGIGGIFYMDAYHYDDGCNKYFVGGWTIGGPICRAAYDYPW